MHEIIYNPVCDIPQARVVERGTMKVLKTIIIVFAMVVFLLIVLFGIYLVTHRQGAIKPSEIVNPEANKSILIASQGSKFKNELLDSVTARLKNKPLSVKVIDVTTLHQISEADFLAIVIIHTTEKWKMPTDVMKFLDRAKDLKKIMLVTTSGAGDWKTKDYSVDVITSASARSELRVLPARISAWIDSTLE
jgi:hypothetical protein